MTRHPPGAAEAAADRAGPAKLPRVRVYYSDEDGIDICCPEDIAAVVRAILREMLAGYDAGQAAMMREVLDPAPARRDAQDATGHESLHSNIEQLSDCMRYCGPDAGPGGSPPASPAAPAPSGDAGDAATSDEAAVAETCSTLRFVAGAGYVNEYYGNRLSDAAQMLDRMRRDRDEARAEVAGLREREKELEAAILLGLDRTAGFREGVEAVADMLEGQGQPGYAAEARALAPPAPAAAREVDLRALLESILDDVDALNACGMDPKTIAATRIITTAAKARAALTAPGGSGL